METTLESLLADLLTKQFDDYFVLGKRHPGEKPGSVQTLLAEYNELLFQVAGFSFADVSLVSSNNGGISFVGQSPSIVSVSGTDYLSVSVIVNRSSTDVSAVKISDSSRAAIDEETPVTPNSIVRTIFRCLSALYPSCIVSDMLSKVTYPQKELSEFLK